MTASLAGGALSFAGLRRDDSPSRRKLLLVACRAIDEPSGSAPRRTAFRGGGGPAEP